MYYLHIGICTSNQFSDLFLYGVLDSFTDYPLVFFPSSSFFLGI